MASDNDKRMTFEELVAEIRTVAPAGRVTVVSYNGLKFALDCGIDIISDYAEMYTLQAVIRDHGTDAQKLRLKETIIAGRWCTEIMLGDASAVASPYVRL
jgi:hypothetical protein